MLHEGCDDQPRAAFVDGDGFDLLRGIVPAAPHAAEVLGVRRATLSDLIHEKSALSPEMALPIEKAFGMSMDTLLSMERWHDGHAMRARAAEIKVPRYEPA